VNNVEIPYHFVSRRKGDASFIVADNSLALKFLDWTPKKSLEEMCFDSFNFIKNQ
jgi:UDP-glucose 4-epimerase